MDKRKQIVIIKKESKTICVYMIGNEIYDCVIDAIDDRPKIGDVYIGRVEKVVDNISAAFVDIGCGKSAFLPFEDGEKIKGEQEIAVQIKKPEKGEKGAYLTRRISLVDRYCVVNLLKDGTYEVIKRTNSKDAPQDKVDSCEKKLVDEMEDIISFSSNRTVLSRLYKEPDFYVRFINSYHSEDVDRIVTDDRDIFQTLTEYDDSLPLELYEDDSYTLDAMCGISSSLEKAKERHVWLKSGATLVIDRAEAMTVVDVNTAKAVDGKRNRETTILKTNLEAADEIARQIRMRNLSGIVIVDFIDMKSEDNINELISYMKKLLKNDPVKANYIDMTKLGLMEITRTKRYRSIYEA